MNEYVWETAEEIDLQVAKRISRVRKRRGITQEQLSEQSGVSFGSIKRFERSGQISLLSLTKLAIALGCADEIRTMFEAVPYGSIEEVVRERK
ncbi:MAG: helix-turn-helix transcriptional regulator [Clostridia bacterium]|nr:helix-turn-helix transcriptional regulator [Clostridia bacterium]MBR5383764.1 helix-turn-helix transcriptional regulator [Clostridia bacterium]